MLSQTSEQTRGHRRGGALVILGSLAGLLLVALLTGSAAAQPGPSGATGRPGAPASSPSATPTPLCAAQWSIVPSANPGPSSYLNAVAAFAVNDVWAVGYYTDTVGVSHTLTEHWNGSQWSVIPSPDVGPGPVRLKGVGGVAGNDVWAVGTSGLVHLVTLHWNGSQWSEVSNPNPGFNYFNDLQGVYAVASNDVWALGGFRESTWEGLFMHWNGAQWQTDSIPGYDDFAGASGAAANDVWAVGRDVTNGASIAAHWDGSAWQMVTVPNVGALTGAAAAAANDVWAVGAGGILHYDGTIWSIWTADFTGLTSMTSAAVNDIWVASASGTFIHWDGTTWSQVPGAGAGILLGVSAVSSSDIWAVGYQASGLTNATLIEHFAVACPTATPALTATPISATVTPTATVTGTPPMMTPIPSPTWPPPTTTCCYASGAVTVACTLPDTYSYDVTLGNYTPYCVIGVCGPVDLYFQVAASPDPFGSWTSLDHLFAGNVCLGTAQFQGTFYEPAIAPPAAYYRVMWAMSYTNCLGTWYSEGYSAAATLCPGPPGPTPTPTVRSSPTPCAVSFSDVHPTDYFYAPVGYLACHGVISGYADGTFRPYANTTRAQQVKMVVLGFRWSLTTPPPDQYTFADVPPTQPFFAIVETGVANHIVSGYTCGGPGEPCDAQHRPYFRPYAPVTRSQLSKIIDAAAGWRLIAPTVGHFADVPPNAPYYAYVETAACHGIVSGYACGGPGEPCDAQNRPYFRQYNNATRGQIAKIVYGALTGGPDCAP